MTERSSKVLEFAKSVGARWPSIEISYDLSRRKLAELELLLRPVESYDFSIVVSGSLGRLEYTDGSDIDWSLLVDGIASPGHHTVLNEIGPKIHAAAGKKTGAEGTFGQFVSSHDLVQKIGGEDDTNSNTTRRLLLLLESTAIGHSVA